MGALVFLVLCVSALSTVIDGALHASPAASAPLGYSQLDCDGTLGTLWAPESAFLPPVGLEPPILGFFDEQLIAKVYYIFPQGHELLFGGNLTVDASIASVTLAPARFRPHKTSQSYELILMVQHPSPISVNCNQGGTMDTESDDPPADPDQTEPRPHRTGPKQHGERRGR